MQTTNNISINIMQNITNNYHSIDCCIGQDSAVATTRTKMAEDYREALSLTLLYFEASEDYLTYQKYSNLRMKEKKSNLEIRQIRTELIGY